MLTIGGVFMDYFIKVEEFMKIVKEFNKIKESSSIPNVDRGYMAVMSKLYFNKEMYSCQIAKELNISRARLSLIVKNLKAKKYISSHFHLKDKRKILIKITEEGSNIVKETYYKTLSKVDGLFNKLGEEKTSVFLEILHEVIEIIKNDKGEVKC
jgi:DNA-binding MarR family transcriptional regulator